MNPAKWNSAFRSVARNLSRDGEEIDVRASNTEDAWEVTVRTRRGFGRAHISVDETERLFGDSSALVELLAGRVEAARALIAPWSGWSFSVRCGRRRAA